MADEEVIDNQILVVIIRDEEYQEKITELAREISQFSEYTCYVSLNKPYKTLIRSLEKENVDISKFFFVDAITKTAEIPQEIDNCEYVSSPGALTELSLSISNILTQDKVKLVLFDSLSTLLVYEKVDVITKFIHSLMAKIRVSNCRAVFTCLRQDSGSVLLKDVNMFADKIIDMERWPSFR